MSFLEICNKFRRFLVLCQFFNFMTFPRAPRKSRGFRDPVISYNGFILQFTPRISAGPLKALGPLRPHMLQWRKAGPASYLYRPHNELPHIDR